MKNSEYIEFDGFHAHIGSQITAGDCYVALEKKLIL